MATEGRQKIVSDEGFIDSIRDLGITTRDAVNELVDNSLDNNAINVWITVGNRDGVLFLMVEDDGDGIPETKLQGVLSFGGRIPSRRTTTGKFGWGLKASASCQSPRTEVYSKQAEDVDFHFNYIDLQELKSNHGYLPETVKMSPFNRYKGIFKFNLKERTKSGTIVIMMELDRPEWLRKETLAEHVQANLAQVQRRFLANGKNIFVNGKKTSFFDPLMLMDGFYGEDECGKGKIYGEIEPIIIPEINDADGNPAKVEIKISLLPVSTIMEKGLQTKYGISTDNQGFYIMRNDRQIADAQTLNLYRRHPSYNYFRGEISFPPCLDRHFGVQTNKSRFSLDDSIRQQLADRVEDLLSQLVNDTEYESNKVKAKEAKGSDLERPTSEEIADEASDLLRPSTHVPTKEEVEEAKKKLEKEKHEIIKKIKDDPTLTPAEKTERIDKIIIAFQQDRKFQRIIGVLGTGEFYTMKHMGKRIDVIINSEHGFFKHIYERATQNPRLQVLLDLFLFTLAKAEDIYFGNKSVRDFYRSQRREWSSIMSTFLDVAERVLDD